jgi:hypothetical protein
MGFPVWLALPADLFERLKDFWVLGLEPPIHGDVLRGVFVEEDQRVSDVVASAMAVVIFSIIVFLASVRMPAELR